ncbi:MMPL family transporter [Lacticaseibacillus zeae]|uniref:MMPL family transporter n=1 Tax=Lacticaseibacillus zeae TaxID=57037 RepID=A0A5R8LPC1_LACZE|nr:MMPL family transporter [Lacticaseibacillus zeae]TLF39099.1 MMPL family transporter [Lacticaseibacillus zeae]
MKKLRNRHIPALIFWLVVILVTLVTMPDVSGIVRDKGALSLPKNEESQVAANIEKKANHNQKVRSFALVFSNGDKKLTATQKKAITKTLKGLKDSKAVKIVNVTQSSDNAETKKQLDAKDGTTQMALVDVKAKGQVRPQTKNLEQQIKTANVKTYVTGSDVLNDDFATVTEKGIQKTEIIAAIFIFIVLIIVFRSPIVPLVSLLTVAISFLTSLNIIMTLADKANFPISNFTQVFLVVVLFGIGTDYNILLYDDFKAALSQGIPRTKAAGIARRFGGRTILYSGLSVLIGFSVLGLANFKFYRSAVGVAIGVLILLTVLLTLNMFFMATMGEKLFWPSKNLDGHSTSRLWHGLSKVGIARPLITLGVIGIIAVPFLLNANQTLNFNNADELPETLQSKVGYRLIQDHYSKGMASPTTIYIQSKHPLNSQTVLGTIDDVTTYLQQEKGVKTVASVTQPGGSKIKSLYLNDQLKTINSGLTQSVKGLKQVQAGLNDANTQIKNANVAGSTQQVQTLADGTTTLSSGASSLSSGISQYTSGVTSLNNGLGQLSSQLPTLTSGVNTLSTGSTQLAKGMNELNSNSTVLASGMNQLSSKSGELTSGMDTLNNQIQTLTGTAQQIITLINQLPDASQLTQPILDKINAFSSGVQQLTDGTSALGDGIKTLNAGTTAMNNGIGTLTSGTNQLNSGINSLNSQVPTLVSGVNQLSSGSSQLASQNGTLNNGASQIASGADQVNTGVQTLNTKIKAISQQVSSMQSGLTSANQALGTIADGSTSMKQYLTELQRSYLGKKFYIPNATLKSNTFKPALSTYMADNNKITKLTVVLKGDPSTDAAAQQIKAIKTDLTAKLKHTPLDDATVAIGGQTSQTADLQDLANGDFERTAAIMIIGIGIALIVVTRSVVQPISIITTLLMAYITSLGLTRLFSTYVLGRAMLTWNTPFFSFIMLVALGVDYSIFLMVRYRDNALEGITMTQRIAKAATVIGAVVISAAVILSGTFAAMIPSGITTLIQVALAVIIGLILLVFLLPLVMSSVISLTDKQMHKNNHPQGPGPAPDSDAPDPDGPTKPTPKAPVVTPAAANSMPEHPQPSSHAAPRVHLAAMPTTDSQASPSKTSRHQSK